ncbi:transglutaminase domain-containing protein [Promicromonospora sp. NPDC057138]|uniref:transglutaminase domain-containing protein n=1 Tax=Promicromonospora sp. NPDC057138 TaxID=3346031 RepID=UPI00363FBB37
MIPTHRGPLVRTVASAVLVVIAVIASMHALTLVIDPGPWLTAGTTGVILVSATSCLVRYLLIRAAVDRAAVRRAAGQGVSADRAADRASGSASFVATAAGAIVAFWFVLARYGGPGQRFEPFVGPDAFDQVLERFRQATETMSTQVAPVGPDEAISMVAVGGTLLVFLVVDSLAGARMPGFAGVPLLLLWTPPLTLIGEVPWQVFVISVTAMLLLLTVDPVGVTPGRHRDADSAAVRRAQRFRSWITAGTAVAVAAASLGVATGMATLPALAGTWNQLISTPSNTVELSSELDMRQPLSARSASTVLTYTMADGDPSGPLRVMTLTAFDGVQTNRNVPSGGMAEFDSSTLLAPEGEDATGEGRRMDVRIGQLTGAELPLPLEPRLVDVEGDWGYDALRDEVRSSAGTGPGAEYSVEIIDRQLTPDLLRAAPLSGDPRSAGFTLVPDTEHRDDIANYAREIAGDAPTRFDAAVALQNHLRSGQGFVYNPDADYRGSSDTVWDFLQNKEGYCTQYALSMMVMARTLGIPARIGIGWLPGRSDGQGGFRVTGQDSHAWPEIYFPSVGWVRFEPTPQVQTGPLPSYANPGVGSAPSSAPTPTRANEVPTQRPAQDPEQSDPAAGADASPGNEVSDQTLPGWAWVVAIIVALGVLGGAAWLLLRRRTEAEVLDPERAWSRVLALLAEQDVRLGPSITLRRAPAFIADEVRTRTGTPLPDDIAERLTALADAAEEERYARRPTSPTAAELEELTTTVTTELTEVLTRPR